VFAAEAARDQLREDERSSSSLTSPTIVTPQLSATGSGSASADKINVLTIVIPSLEALHTDTATQTIDSVPALIIPVIKGIDASTQTPRVFKKTVCLPAAQASTRVTRSAVIRPVIRPVNHPVIPPLSRPVPRPTIRPVSRLNNQPQTVANYSYPTYRSSNIVSTSPYDQIQNNHLTPTRADPQMQSTGAILTTSPSWSGVSTTQAHQEPISRVGIQPPTALWSHTRSSTWSGPSGTTSQTTVATTHASPDSGLDAMTPMWSAVSSTSDLHTVRPTWSPLTQTQAQQYRYNRVPTYTQSSALPSPTTVPAQNTQSSGYAPNTQVSATPPPSTRPPPRNTPVTTPSSNLNTSDDSLILPWANTWFTDANNNAGNIPDEDLRAVSNPPFYIV
jgi:hypothetical protein